MIDDSILHQSDEEFRKTAQIQINRSRRFRKLMTVWITVFSLIVIYGYNKTHQQSSDIQKQRKESILRSCKEQNQRHDNTIQALNDIISKIKDPAQKKAAQATVGSTILFIDALAPKQNCDQIVNQSTS